ncbi:unnamed protein product [Albugo candida]|uniref:Uncharacterized protein n=1 Tax=Albugo candida TaxID=65357 RepID=A0A024GBY2_9STRA|nr:unnamed protein product [Albugo candida]|eukprot:CCI44040.1 unnamed protein product [Albugo candida]
MTCIGSDAAGYVEENPSWQIEEELYYNTRHREEVGEINSVFYLVRSCFASFYQSLSYLSRISLGTKLTIHPTKSYLKLSLIIGAFGIFRFTRHFFFFCSP